MVLNFWWVFFHRWGSQPRTWKGRGKILLRPLQGEREPKPAFWQGPGQWDFESPALRAPEHLHVGAAAWWAPGWRAGPVCPRGFGRRPSLRLYLVCSPGPAGTWLLSASRTGRSNAPSPRTTSALRAAEERSHRARRALQPGSCKAGVARALPPGVLPSRPRSARVWGVPPPAPLKPCLWRRPPPQKGDSFVFRHRPRF